MLADDIKEVLKVMIQKKKYLKYKNLFYSIQSCIKPVSILKNIVKIPKQQAVLRFQ